jgi:hypothetical protein
MVGTDVYPLPEFVRGNPVIIPDLIVGVKSAPILPLLLMAIVGVDVYPDLTLVKL